MSQKLLAPTAEGIDLPFIVEGAGLVTKLGLSSHTVH